MTTVLQVLELIGRGYVALCGALMLALLVCLAWTNRGRARRWLRDFESAIGLCAAALIVAVLAPFLDEHDGPRCFNCRKPLDPTIAVGEGARYCGPCERARIWARAFYAKVERESRR